MAAIDGFWPRQPEFLPSLVGAGLRRRRLAGWLAAAFVCIAYLLLINRYWHFTTDSALYMAVARSICGGRGYTFNGFPHSQVPGGWPYALAALLRISTSFLWLNVVQTGIVLGGLAFLYAALRQMLDRATAVLALFLAGISFWVYEYSCALMSEAPFFLFSNVAVYLLLRYVRCTRDRFRAPLLAAACAALAIAFSCRLLASYWVGPFAVTALFGGRGNRPLRSRVPACVVILAVVVCAFGVYRHWSNEREGGSRNALTPSAPHAQQDAGVAADTDEGDAGPLTGGGYGPLGLGSFRSYLLRARILPRWLPHFFWPPYAAVVKVRAFQPAVNAGSWLCLAIVLLGCWRAVRSGQVFLPACLLFLGPFVVWTSGGKSTTGRYMIALGPYAIVLLLYGLAEVGALLERRVWRRLSRRTLVATGVALLVVSNLPLLLGDIWVHRRPDFYCVFRGGGYAGLMGALKWIGDNGGGEDVMARRYPAIRAVAAMTDSHVVSLRRDIEPWRPRFIELALPSVRRSGARYLLAHDYSQPWPVWHIPRKYLYGVEARDRRWLLWEYDPETDALNPVDFEPLCSWPTHVPLKPRQASP